MADIFISYRRQDAAGWVLGLARDLRAAIPDSKIFHDIASIAIGEDFLEAIERSLQSCGVVLVVIGPHWLDIRDEAGERRLDDPEDWVRLEVAASLNRPGLKVVPVRVGGAAMPRPAALPEPLRPLARRHAHEITDTRWDYDVRQLVEALRRILPVAVAPNSTAAPKVGGVADEPNAIDAPAPADDRQPAAGNAGSRQRALDRSGSKAEGTTEPDMVRIPAGSILMGSLDDEEGCFDDEGPAA